MAIRIWFLAGCAALPSLFAQAPVRYDSGTISGLAARNIGSAQMSGRIAAVAAVDDGGRLTVFAATASGGVWKSVNAGTTFKSVFDNPSVQSMGAIAIDPRNSKNVWAGSGETWTRNSVSIGDGVYKSTDGGENWTNVGLKDSERIAKILVDPRNSDSVLVCATGHLWDDSTERGVYKTTDGGKNWRKVLAGANPSTGCGMLSSSPQDPATIYASLWDFRRQAWTFRSGGAGSGLFKSTDGGEHWSEISPATAKGLAGEAVRPHRAGRRARQTESGLRHDRGRPERALPLRRWRRELDEARCQPVPGLAALLLRQPDRGPEGREQSLQGRRIPDAFQRNGGHSFGAVSGSAHGDFHDVWIDPAHTEIRLHHRRWRTLAQPRWRPPLGAHHEPPGLAVLSRERG